MLRVENGRYRRCWRRHIAGSLRGGIRVWTNCHLSEPIGSDGRGIDDMHRQGVLQWFSPEEDYFVLILIVQSAKVRIMIKCMDLHGGACYQTKAQMVNCSAYCHNGRTDLGRLCKNTLLLKYLHKRFSSFLAPTFINDVMLEARMNLLICCLVHPLATPLVKSSERG